MARSHIIVPVLESHRLHLSLFPIPLSTETLAFPAEACDQALN